MQSQEEIIEESDEIETITITYLDNKDFNRKDDLNNAQIYLIINKTNEKKYVGKANCFTGANNFKWGTLGRWKSHVDEACKKNDDHCVLLNNAIRKYGENNFEIYTIYKGPIETIGDYESYYIKYLNTLKPYGYNLRSGGDKGKNNIDTIQKMKEAHTGHVHSEKQKENISKGQIGNRRGVMKRRHDEDNDLPKYIYTMRNKNIPYSYAIANFPIGISEKEYLKTIQFTFSKYGSKESALNAAKECLAKLNEQYQYVEDETKNLKVVANQLSAIEKKENQFKDKLPEYINPIIVDSKIKGYYVDGISDKNGKPYPKRFFIENTNRWNLDQAKKFIDILNYFNSHDVKAINIDFLNLEINDVEKSFYEEYYLPMYFNVLRKKGEIKGFVINGFPDDKYKDGKYKKEFQMMGRTMDEVYKEGIAFLEKLKIGKK